MELFIVSALIIMLGTRLSVLETRGFSTNKPLFSVILNLVGSFASLSILVFGFMNFDWWIPIVIFIGMPFIANPIVDKNMSLFFTIEPIMNLIIIGFSIYFWFI